MVELNFPPHNLSWCGAYLIEPQGPIEESGEISRYGDCLWAGGPRGRSSSPAGVNTFLFSTASRTVCTPPPKDVANWSLRLFLRGPSHYKLVPMSRKRGSVHQLPHTSLFRSA
jgi:hypothetical protein